jgi:hypothetical protein
MAIKLPNLNNGVKLPNLNNGVKLPNLNNGIPFLNNGIPNLTTEKIPTVSEILKSQSAAPMSYGSPTRVTPLPEVVNTPVVNKPIVDKSVVNKTPISNNKNIVNTQTKTGLTDAEIAAKNAAANANNLLRSQIEIAAEADALAKQKAELANKNSTTSASNITASSSNFQSLIDKLTKSIDDMSKSNPVNATEYLSQYATDLEQRRKEAEQNINAEFDSTKQRTETAQGRETGQFGATLNRIGGYLGGSASSSGAMNALNSDQRFELQTLEAKRQSALTAARSAYDDKSFAVAKARADEAKSYEQEIYKRQNDFLDNTMQLLTGAQSFRSSQIGTADKMLENITSPDLISPTTRSEIDAIYGNGFTDKYAAYKQVASQAESSKKATESYKAYVDLLQSIPTGQTVSMPDGAKVTGMGKSSDLNVFKTENANGQVTITAFNPMTGKLQNYGAGAIGTANKEGQKAQSMTVAIPKMTKAIYGDTDPTTGQIIPGTGLRDSTGYIGDIKNDKGEVIKTGVQVYNDLSQIFLQENPLLGISTFRESFPEETFVHPTQRGQLLKGNILGLATGVDANKDKKETKK